MNWKTWIHSLVAAAIGGAASALGSILISPASFPDTTAGWEHLGTIAAFGAVVPVLALLKQSPRKVDESKTSKLPVLLLAALLLPAGLAGCHRATSATAPAALAPEAVNSFDQQAYQNLLSFQAALTSLRTSIQADPNLETLKPAFEQARIAYNTAEAAWQIYHAAATEANKASLSAALNNVQTDVTNLKKAVTP
jgi:hypothetical protein